MADGGVFFFNCEKLEATRTSVTGPVKLMVKSVGFSSGKSWIYAQLGHSLATLPLPGHLASQGPRVPG